MNAILACLDRHRESFDWKQYGLSPQSRYILKTPRFHASRHVVLMHVPENSTTPTLVVKVPRLPDDRSGVDHEAAALREVASRAGEAARTIPHLVGLFDCGGHPALVQTALVGRPLDPATIRRDREQCCRDVTDWLIHFHRATAQPLDNDIGWCQTQVDLPLSILETILGDNDEDRRCLSQARNQFLLLREQKLSSVIEHGDFGHPNLFRLSTGEIGVIDWELSDPAGIPVADLWFFLSYVASIDVRSSSVPNHLEAFRTAFASNSSWTNSHVERYLRALDIPPEAVTPLFALAWTRYLAKMAGRLGTSENEPGANLEDETGRKHLANWIRNNRYYAFWREAVTRHSW